MSHTRAFLLGLLLGATVVTCWSVWVMGWKVYDSEDSPVEVAKPPTPADQLIKCHASTR